MPKNFSDKQSHAHWYIKAWNWTKTHIVEIGVFGLFLGFNRFFYLLARLISHNIYSCPADELNISFPFERAIPLNSFTASFAIPYLLSFLYWIIIPFVIYGTLGKKAFYRFIGGTLMAYGISFLFMAFLPTKQDPSVYAQARQWLYGGGDLSYYGQDNLPINPDLKGWDKLNATILNMVYDADCPDNLCPSYHNICTFLPFLIYVYPDEKGKRHWLGFSLTLFFYILVATSTLCTRQHCIMDVIVAIGMCGISFGLSRVIKLGSKISNFNDWFNQQIGVSLKNARFNRKHALRATLYLSIWFILIIACIFFGAISLITGDPFKGGWHGNWTSMAFCE
ncbi:MAG: hypothetical protein LBL60_01655 [Mycoplasmataceae bacterium]|nr:hypothetical protein [Mycoplasmataceae bacterium]